MFDYNYYVGMKLARKKDYKRAVHYLTLSADAGNNDAINNIGVTFQRRKRYEEAANCYKDAANKGVVAAMYNLGHLYRLGYGVEQDYVKAFILLKKAAKRGYSSAYNEIADMYVNGEGGEKNILRAYRYLKEGVKLEKKDKYDNTECLSYLAYFYDMGYVVKKNPKKAHKLWKKAAERGDLYAQHCIAVNYLKGVVVKKDVEEGLKLLFKLASVNNYNRAIEDLVTIYEEGEYIKKDLKEATLWLAEGATNSSSKCCLHFAEIILEGKAKEYEYIDENSLPGAILDFLNLVTREENLHQEELELYNSLKQKYPDALDWDYLETLPESPEKDMSQIA